MFGGQLTPTGCFRTQVHPPEIHRGSYCGHHEERPGGKIDLKTSVLRGLSKLFCHMERAQTGLAVWSGVQYYRDCLDIVFARFLEVEYRYQVSIGIAVRTCPYPRELKVPLPNIYQCRYNRRCAFLVNLVVTVVSRVAWFMSDSYRQDSPSVKAAIALPPPASNTVDYL